MATNHNTHPHASTTVLAKNAKIIKRDRSNENFKKRWRTFKNNGFQLYQDYEAQVYICIRRKGDRYEFKSTDKALPFSEEEKVRAPIKTCQGYH
ncbi:hypothetical protein BFJ68_g17097 [Fusarium oxysporum]|uniref:MADS-box domain-containing protein n=3 Tax=Fusarium oxysporum TaxID=5507 RepID=A0A420P314_FUSOX|nr:hypothetical protein FOZG_17971 [Fusarium oxysporum Fo47]RKK86912.1 hypothetical protein BFJ68_g17097 [Fusarium oxysporum]